MKKCPTCGAQHLQLQDVPKATMDAMVREMAAELVRYKRVPNRAAGGLARAAKMSPEQRSQQARKAAQARWAKP